MNRTLICLLGIGWMLASAAPGQAQEWARKMFRTTTHDFGAVMRGATPSYEFEFSNNYKEDLHVADVRSSCGCTAAVASNRGLIHSRERAAIVATFNSRSFHGQKNATITVVFDRPYRAEVQLHVSGLIRDDVAVQPSAIEFGQLDGSVSPEIRVQISRAGNPRWRIVDVRSANPNFEVELSNPQGGNQISYEMIVRLKTEGLSGYVQDQLTVISNEEGSAPITIPVNGRVVSSLSVSPASLFLGVVESGQTVTKQLVVRGKGPFRVMNVQCNDESFQFGTSEEMKTLHIIPVTFTAHRQGKIVRNIEITTSGGSANCTATATVQ